MQWMGYAGLTALALCWIPQSVDTIRKGVCTVNGGFLFLSALGSTSLAIYALSIGDPVFTVLNILTTAGALMNLWFKFFPRRSA